MRKSRSFRVTGFSEKMYIRRQSDRDFISMKEKRLSNIAPLTIIKNQKPLKKIKFSMLKQICRNNNKKNLHRSKSVAPVEKPQVGRSRSQGDKCLIFDHHPLDVIMNQKIKKLKDLKIQKLSKIILERKDSIRITKEKLFRFRDLIQRRFHAIENSSSESSPIVIQQTSQKLIQKPSKYLPRQHQKSTNHIETYIIKKQQQSAKLIVLPQLNFQRLSEFMIQVKSQTARPKITSSLRVKTQECIPTSRNKSQLLYQRLRPYFKS